MTRDAEHTPSPQSVVVPDPLWMMHVIGPDDIYPAPDHATAVQWCAHLNSEIAPKVPEVLCVAVPAIWTGTAEEHAEGLAEAIKGWAVPAAPAPSSLAGGERMAGIISMLERVVGPTASVRIYEHEAKLILAALSPEAPARVPGWPEGMTYGALDDVRSGRGLPPLTPRHEAPAEGAGEVKPLYDRRGGYLSDPDGLARMRESLIATVNWHDPAPINCNSLARLLDTIDALRARSSAPEARDEALGNLLAVIHGDGGHRALEVGVEQAAAEAEKIVARLLSSAPEAREGARGKSRGQVAYEGWSQGLPGCEWDNQTATQKRAWELSANAVLLASPAPSADKLRIAVEALEPFAKEGDGYADTVGDDYPIEGDVTDLTLGDLRRASKALAAMEAEGAK